jgi:hypothetical protein
MLKLKIEKYEISSYQHDKYIEASLGDYVYEDLKDLTHTVIILDGYLWFPHFLSKLTVAYYYIGSMISGGVFSRLMICGCVFSSHRIQEWLLGMFLISWFLASDLKIMLITFWISHASELPYHWVKTEMVEDDIDYVPEAMRFSILYY